jgi:membrane associated rhomboid family serine protease
MDWSLVLVSQGIESTIEHSPEDGSWGLSVNAQDRDAAEAAIGQYRRENRHRAWQKKLVGTGLLFDARSLIWAAGITAFYALSLVRDLKSRGLMDNTAVAAGEWWRLFTATLLHADIAHLAANVTTGILILGLAMGFYGAEVCLLATYLAGVAGNLAGFMIYGGLHRGLGASGVVMGGLGLLTVQSLVLWRKSRSTAEFIKRGVLAGVLLLVLLGLNPASDVVAHLGGFVTGCLFGVVLAFLGPGAVRFRYANRVAGLVLFVLVLTTWWWALR